jgi:ribose-phosphate pyrophosphokinase
MIDLHNATFFYLHGNETLFENTVNKLNAPTVAKEVRRFPDGESYVRIDSDVEGEDLVVFSTLDRPDPKFLPLIYTARTLREQGATSVNLMAPYLSYMRQDKQFKPGEAVTSLQFADLVDRHFDSLVTVDPHLHRYDSLDELYEIPSDVLHADPALSEWIGTNVDDPYLIGPDSESEQWVSEVAERIDAPYNVLTKVRHGDRDVEITFEDPEERRDLTPVLVDDIISTAGTMIKATRTLLEKDYSSPICVGIHAIFAGEAYEELNNAGARSIVTTNTVAHGSNNIDLSSLFVKSND